MAQFLEWLADACCFGLFLYKWIIIAAVILTWVNADPHNAIVQWIGRSNTPLWVWCENWMPVMMAHFSAYASILVVIFAQIVLPAEIRSLNLLFHGLTDAQSFFVSERGTLDAGNHYCTAEPTVFFHFRTDNMVCSYAGQPILKQSTGTHHSCTC